MPKYTLHFKLNDFYPFRNRGVIEDAVRTGLEHALGVELTNKHLDNQRNTTYRIPNGKVRLSGTEDRVHVRLRLPKPLTEYPGSLCPPIQIRKVIHKKAPPERETLRIFRNALITYSTRDPWDLDDSPSIVEGDPWEDMPLYLVA